MDKLYDLVIVGGGAAGLSSAVYAQRAGLDYIMLDVASSMGSQLTQTDEVENYTGLGRIGGMELVMKFREHARLMGANMADGTVKSIEKDGGVFTVKTPAKEYRSKTVICCTGASHRPLGVKGEDEYKGRGVSYCAVCDGFFYRGKTVAVVGGGDTAVSEALFLSKFCHNVYLIHRRSGFRAARSLTDKLYERDNIKLVLNAEVKEIKGSDGMVRSVVLKDGAELNTDGVFVAVGILPNSAIIADLCEFDGSGFVVADESGKTACDGLFAAGDLRTKPLRQIITACADGANCVASVEKYLNG